jgi:hypothetical protein
MEILLNFIPKAVYQRRFVRPVLLPVFPLRRHHPLRPKTKVSAGAQEGTAGYALQSSLRALNFVPADVFSAYVPAASCCLRRFQTTKNFSPVPSVTSYP